MRTFEDFHPGERIDLGTTVVDEAEMLAFAHRFDPQPFHVDAEAAVHTPFGGLIASGWFSASLFMRLYVDAVLADSTSQGSPGMSELRWLLPVRAGDELRGRLEVLSATPYAHVTTARGIDPQAGRPIPTSGMAPAMGRVVRDVCPASPGAPPQSAVGRNPMRGLFGRRTG